MLRVNTRILFLILNLFPVFSFALVDMRNANYSEIWTDIKMQGSSYELSVVRTYNSRSLFDGMFGFGWCTMYEATIEVTAEGNIELTECGGGLGIIYKPRNFALTEVELTIDKIMKRYRQDEKTASNIELENLKKKLLSDEGLRAKYAKRYKFAVNIQEGKRFYAEGRRIEHFLFKRNFYYRYLEDGSMHKFDTQGNLVGMSDKDGNFLRFTREKGLLTEVVDNNGRKIAFKYYANRKVKELLGPGGVKAHYKFNKNDLIEVKNGWGNVFKYSYSKIHNLIRIEFPDKTYKELTYNSKNDWVTSFRGREGCIESYEYTMSQEAPKDHYWSTVVKQCEKRITNQSRYEFWHKNRKDHRGKYLSRVLFKVNDHETEMVFHPDLGDPVYVRRDEQKTKFSYFPDGLLKTRTDDHSYSTYEYKNKHKKVSSVLTQFFGKNKKVIKKRRTDFEYNGSGNISMARNSDGQQAWIKYDNKGRIVNIRDQAKKVVLIEYEEHFGKPSIVQRPGVGKIKVIYNEKGEMKDIKSKSGPIVAQEVASTFNNLLEIITPGLPNAKL